MATGQRSLRLCLIVGVLVVFVSGCSSGGQPAERAPSTSPTVNELDSFLVGTVWIVDEIGGREPVVTGPSLTFTTGAPLDLTVVDACGSAHMQLGPSTNGTYPVAAADGLSLLCAGVLGDFFRQADHLAIGRGETLVLLSGGSTMSASHVVSESVHPEDFVIDADVPWCADVSRAEPLVRGDLASNQNPDEVAMGVLATYGEENRDRFGGMWIDRDNGGVVVVAFIDDPSSHRAALSLRSPSPADLAFIEPAPAIEDSRPLGEQGFAFDVVQVEHTLDELDAMWDGLALGPEDGLGSSGIRLSLNHIALNFIDPPPGEFAEHVESLPSGVCVLNVHLTPVVPDDIVLLDGDGRFVAEVVNPSLITYAIEPSPESTIIELFVWPGGCTGLEMRRGPEVVADDERVAIAMAEAPAPGRVCPSVLSPSPVTIELEQPLGDRALWNAGLDQPIGPDFSR